MLDKTHRYNRLGKKIWFWTFSTHGKNQSYSYHSLPPAPSLLLALFSELPPAAAEAKLDGKEEGMLNTRGGKT